MLSRLQNKVVLLPVVVEHYFNVFGLTRPRNHPRSFKHDRRTVHNNKAAVVTFSDKPGRNSTLSILSESHVTTHVTTEPLMFLRLKLTKNHPVSFQAASQREEQMFKKSNQTLYLQTRT